MSYEEGYVAVFDHNINGWVRVPDDIELPDNQQDRDMIAHELLVKFQMSVRHPMVKLGEAYKKVRGGPLRSYEVTGGGARHRTSAPLKCKTAHWALDKWRNAMRLKQLSNLGIAALAGAAISFAGLATADSSDPIKISIHNWSSQIVGANIVGKILNEAGHEVDYVPSDSQVVYTSMCEGDVDVVHEVWQGAFGVAFEKVVGEGCVIDLATHDAKTREEWWYPAYVEEVCPGLPDWKALDSCAELFTTPETAPKGRFLAGPVDWLKHDHERVEGLEMNFDVVNAGSAAALWAELKSASRRNHPIVLFNWTPNFIEAIYDGKFIEFPEYDEACKEDPSWGMNPDKTYDCGNPKGGYLKIGVWEGMPDDWPDATRVLKQINFSNLDIAVMAKLADVDGMEPEDAADKWLVDNESRWRAWLEAAGS